MHLHLLVHGLAGNPSHLAEAATIFSDRHPRVHVLVSTSISGNLSYDGIDLNAHRVLNELVGTITALEKDPTVRVTKLSITGYSLGGLIARYLIGLLHSRGFFDTVQPVNFTSFTTPHVGIPPPPYTPRLWFWLGSTLLGRTGKQLHLLDTYADTKRPLLDALARPDSVFFCGLAKFRNITAYANAVNDVTVPYFSAAFEDDDPFLRHPEEAIELEYIPNYTPLIQNFTLTPATRARFRLRRPRTFNGPFIAWVFPWNLTLYLLLPLLLPIAIAYLIISSLVALHASRGRVRALMQDSVAAALTLLPGNFSAATKNGADCRDTEHPIMSEHQFTLVRALNTLGTTQTCNLRKFTAFRPNVRNSHAMLVCLEPRWADHRAGRGVLRHWADGWEE